MHECVRLRRSCGLRRLIRNRVGYRSVGGGGGGRGPRSRRAVSPSRHPQRWLCALSFIRGAWGRARRGEDVARRPTPDDIDFHNTPALPSQHPTSSALRSRLPTSSDPNYALSLPLHGSNCRPASARADSAAPCRPLMNPLIESHSVEIPTSPPRRSTLSPRWKNRPFATIKMVNQTNFSNCEVKVWRGGARSGALLERVWFLMELLGEWWMFESRLARQSPRAQVNLIISSRSQLALP